MEFENTFDVHAPIDEVWRTMLDVERVAPCVPGAEVLERTGEDSYLVGVKVKLGPITQQYRGTIEITDKDEASHHATMNARAREARGQGTATAQVEMRLAAENSSTRATIQTSMSLSGKAAAMGRGVIGDVAAGITDQFASNLAAMLSGPVEEPAAAAAPATGESPPATAEPPPPRAADEAALPILPILGRLAAGKLRDRRALGLVAAAAVLVLLLLVRGRR